MEEKKDGGVEKVNINVYEMLMSYPFIKDKLKNRAKKRNI
jgi:hypothetical protein